MTDTGPLAEQLAQAQFDRAEALLERDEAHRVLKAMEMTFSLVHEALRAASWPNGDPLPLEHAARQVVTQLAAASAERDTAYRERSELLALLATHYANWRTGHDAKPGDLPWDPEWLTVIGLQLPTGQCSWHVHDRDVELFPHVKPLAVKWDGHTTLEKYERVRAEAKARAFGVCEVPGCGQPTPPGSSFCSRVHPAPARKP